MKCFFPGTNGGLEGAAMGGGDDMGGKAMGGGVADGGIPAAGTAARSSEVDPPVLTNDVHWTPSQYRSSARRCGSGYQVAGG